MTESGVKLLDFESTASVGEMKPEAAEEEVRELVSKMNQALENPFLLRKYPH